VVVGAEAARHLAGVRGLVVLALLEADRKRLHRLAQHLAHVADDGAGVDAAGEERAERHVRDQVRGDALAQRRVETFHPLRFAERFVGAELEVPVARRPFDPAVVRDPHPVRGRQLPHLAEDRVRRRDVLKLKVEIDGLQVRRRLELRQHGEGLELRGEGDDAVLAEDVEWLDAEAIAGEEELPPLRVPDREREHAAQAFEATLAPLLVRVHDHFRVAVRAEPVAERFELALQLGEVVELPVVRDPERAILVRDRLLAARGIDDRQAAMPERGRAIEEEAVAVGTAMAERSGHSARRALVRRCAVDAKQSRDSAHAGAIMPGRRACAPDCRRGSRTAARRA
jgi:hypothetical protein